MVPSKIDKLRDIPAETLQYFLEHRDSEEITPEIRQYILMVDAVARYTHDNDLSVRRIIERLQAEFPVLTYNQARNVYYDALDYFYLDDGLSARAWDNVYAEKFEDLGKLALTLGKISDAYKCFAKAHELRTLERESKDVDWRAPVFLVNMTVRPEDLGFKSQKLADISRRQEDEQFRAMIMGLSVPDAEKKRMMAEAGLKWVEPEAKEEPDEQ